MKQNGPRGLYPLAAHRDTLMWLNDTVGWSACSTVNLIARCKWMDGRAAG